MNKEYIYNIDKYTIGVDENGKDEIGLTIAIIKNGEINVLGNCYGENARCLDLLIKENEELKKQLHEASLQIQELIEQDLECPSNCEKLRQLKKQLENTINSYTEEHNLRHNSDLKLDVLKTQQKEFINYLEYKINICDGFLDTIKSDLQEISYRVMSANKTYITTQIKENEIAHKVYEEILQKYKEIIGDKDEN